MLKSMTGFGLAASEYKSSKITVEVKSLNSKFLELAIKLPKVYLNQEMLIRSDCQKLVDRGKLSVVITIDSAETRSSRPARIDKGLLIEYYKELEVIAAELNQKQSDLLALCLTLPEVVKMEEQETADEAEWALVYTTFLKAVSELDLFRADEGKVLHADIEARIQMILELLDYVELSDTKRIPTIKEKLYISIEALIGKANIDMNRLEQELIYYVEKLDITEEKIRLKSHCDYFLQALTSGEANGKKLGFISQEIGREINTIGSKVNEASIQQKVILMKDELEKIKEQLLNIL